MAKSTKTAEKQKQADSKQQARQISRKQSEVVQKRRQLSKKQREERDQRRFLTVVGAAVGIAVLVLLGGFLYQQLWYPSRPVARVGSDTLSRDDYWQMSRASIAQEIAQNFQLLALFGTNEQFGTQFQNRSPGLNQQAELVTTQPENAQLIDQWVERQLIVQGAAELGISLSQAELNQSIVENYTTFLPPDAVPAAPTDPLTGTETLTGTGSTTQTLTGTDSTTDTAAAPAVPPTPAPAEAANQVDLIIEEIYQQYSTELELAAIEPALDQADFRRALEMQQQQQVLATRVQEALIPADSFTASTEPEQVRARHILLAVDVPEQATEEEIDAAYAERREEAEDLVEQVRDGADFAELAAELSDDPGSAALGGDVGFFDPQGLTEEGVTYAPEFAAAAFALEVDEISDPVRTEFGWHIIQVTEQNIPDPEQQLETARTEAFEEWLELQREEVAVRRFPEPTATPEGTPAAPDDEELPTPVPTYAPGPPTPLPTPLPTPAPDVTEPITDTDVLPETEPVTETQLLPDTRIPSN